MEPSLEFWHQLVQLMPAVQQVSFIKHLAAASSADTSLEANLRHITVTLATWDAVWEVPHVGKEKLEEEVAEVSMERHKRVKQQVVFFGMAGIGTRHGASSVTSQYGA
ncbi:hypothetical protein HaLaN_13029 [Haematococcus lacustris]|uniref:Uncharacterized protein n=1 Tax=Haematococcus lacustris TaxID=44745 RepID=A0A699ZBH5_HAELA|nr:hypothetical protein HaLaN_13029 [Haematococcus lacustris]